MDNIWNVYEAQARLAKGRFGDIVAEAQILYLASEMLLKLRNRPPDTVLRLVRVFLIKEYAWMPPNRIRE